MFFSGARSAPTFRTFVRNTFLGVFREQRRGATPDHPCRDLVSQSDEGGPGAHGSRCVRLRGPPR